MMTELELYRAESARLREENTDLCRLLDQIREEHGNALNERDQLRVELDACAAGPMQSGEIDPELLGRYLVQYDTNPSSLVFWRWCGWHWHGCHGEIAHRPAKWAKLNGENYDRLPGVKRDG